GPRTRPALECWTLLAAVAAEVGRRPGGGVRVGTLVTRAGLRAPGVGVGVGRAGGGVAGAPPVGGVGRGDVANRAENLAFGLPFGDAAERAGEVGGTAAALRAALPAARPTGTTPERRSQDRSGLPEVWVGGTGAGARELA